MEIEYSKGSIVFEKKLNALDEFTLEFTRVLSDLGIRYVIISGYIAILFGRSRQSEDIDLFVEKMDKNRFSLLWEELSKKYECVNAPTCDNAFDDYITTGLALRFARKGTYIPNMEMKFPKTKLDEHILSRRVSVVVNEKQLFISPLEGQIAFKLSIGSDKDIEDAIYLYVLFQEYLDMHLFQEACRNLHIPREVLDQL